MRAFRKSKFFGFKQGCEQKERKLEKTLLYLKRESFINPGLSKIAIHDVALKKYLYTLVQSLVFMHMYYRMPQNSEKNFVQAEVICKNDN